MAMLSRNLAEYLKQQRDRRDNGKRGGSRRSPSKLRCYECNGIGHVHLECPNLQRHDKKMNNKSDSDTDSDHGSTRGDDDVAGSEDDAEGFDLAKKFGTLYAQWLTMVEENSVLDKEKVKLEAQIGKALKHASEKEEEARQARVQLEETQKGLRMLNTGTNQLDHLLSIGQNDRCGLGFKGKSSKGGCVFVSAGATENIATYATKPAAKVLHAVEGETSDEANIWEKHQMKQTYGMRFHNPVCYCEAEGHVQRGGLNSGHRANHGGIRLMDTWFGRSGHYGDGGMGFYPQYGGWRSSSY
ncbi:hypothetical protein F2Q69_00007950 [Brassica cretica]|uniref:CCHC-type domain-containing protein n=1 Tax=Brassica cretica TaxID=69181 RepID=A0A8S9P097_BRACR|nr:hypothetical protein F2Q69_00007950 [Brassica cretica]